jgi:type I restriction enzyme S subunit
MSKKKGLIPKFRFPEFTNEGDWTEVSIDSLGDVVTGGTPSKEDNGFWDGDFVWVTAQDFKEKYIYNSVSKLSNKGKEKSRIIPKNSVLVTCIASIGLNGINKIECATNQQINSIVCNSSNNYEFVYYAISRNITRLKNLAGQTAIPIISKSVFERFTILKPKLPKEQQKIAACLSSLDEVIAAHSQKLDLLKAHKKGLMQNLFPKRDEKVPKYRFKEFVKDGEWVENKLGDLGQLLGGGTPDRSNSSYWIGDIPWISSSDIKEDNIHNISITRFINKNAIKESATKVIPKGSVLFVSRVGVGKLAISKEEICTSQDFTNFVPKKDVLNFFIGYYFSSNKNLLQSLNQGTSIKGFSKSDLESIKFPYPKTQKEQQKIASCLSTLDEIITAQAEKIEQLKLHKKGLMQGLFPKMND